WWRRTSHASLADRQLRASQARQSSGLPASTMLTSLLMSGSWPRREDVHVVLVVHHAEKVAERVDDRRGDEAGATLDRLFVRCRPQGQQPPEAGPDVVHVPVHDHAAGIVRPAGRREPAVEDAELVLVGADAEFGVGEPALDRAREVRLGAE